MPPLIVAVKVTVEIFGGVKEFSTPSVVVNKRLPLAAVRMNVPTAVLLVVSTRSSEAAVKRPRCVVVPVNVALMTSVVAGSTGPDYRVKTSRGTAGWCRSPPGSAPASRKRLSG